MAATKVQLEYSAPSENGRFIRAVFDAFAKSIFVKNIYGGADVAAKIAYKGIEDYGNYKKSDAHMLKAVDPATNESLGYARWGIPVDHGIESGSPKLSEEEAEKFENAEKYRPDGIRKDWEQMAKKLITEKRKEYLKDGDITLESLLVDPVHQRKGVGAELLRWGMEIADKKNARIYLEATEVGSKLYLKYGWRTISEVKYDFSRNGGEGTWVLILMVRDPQVTQDGV